MTLIENDSPKVQYTGPFIKGQLLPLTFPYIATEDVKMIIDDKPAIFNVDYEIITEPNDEHPVAYPNSAYIKSDLPNAKQITLYRVTPLDQQAPFPQQSKFRSERVEQALDKLTMQQQEQEEQLSRCIIAPITLETFNGQLPAPAPDQALKWNTEGTELENYDIIGEQEAFETDVNTRFEEQSTAIENRIGQFEEETNTQFSEFRNEINENLDAVLNAADKLETLDQQVQAATDAANTALTSATKADAYAEEAFMSADQAEDALEEIKQVIQDAEDTIGELVQNTGFPMFSPQWSDHFYNDASFLRADTFSWHYADMYVTAYEEILKQYNNPEATEQTDGDIIYKLSPDGFRIALASEHDKVLERYLDGEKAWFYILDTENQRFKLPREKKTDGKYLYFYVGTYERPEAEVNLGTVTDALNNKVDLDGGNYKGSGLEEYINTYHQSQITNCLLEVPQRIKYELVDGTLTIKAGSVVIVPYGTTDRTSEFPVGSTFINDNFKVYDTQFADGKFFVWAELVGDISHKQANSSNETRLLSIPIINETNIPLIFNVWSWSGADAPPTTAAYQWYDTANNKCVHTVKTTGDISVPLISLPILIVSSNGTDVFSSVNQVFNGMGYIGSHKWLDKGVKLLCSNGRNEDGTLKNLETIAEKLSLYTGGTANVRYNAFYDVGLGYVARISQIKNTFVVNSLSELDDKAGAYVVAYVIPENKFYVHDANEPWEHFIGAQVGYHVNINSDGTVSEFTPYMPFRAVDYSEFSNIVSSPITALCTTNGTTASSASSTEPAVVVKNYKNGYSWYRVWSDGWIEQGGQNTTDSAEATITLLYKFTATNYYVNLQMVNQRSGSQQNITPYSKTVSNFKRTCNGGTEYKNPIAWYACGY